MCSAFRSLVFAVSFFACGSAHSVALRVCADPNNLPFTNAAGEGFENKIAELLAKDLGEPVEYAWRPQRRGFIRSTLKANLCDLIAGVPNKLPTLATSAPYYRSSYVFVTRRASGLEIGSFDDPRLRQLRIGVQMIGDDGFNTPPAHALTMRGIIENVRGYTVYGNYAEPNPPARIIDAVAKGEIDVAIAWGPLAGYFASKQPTPLRIEPVAPRLDAGLPMAFDISMGVRRQDEELLGKINAVLEQRKSEINAILDRYGVPRVAPDKAVADSPP